MLSIPCAGMPLLGCAFRRQIVPLCGHGTLLLSRYLNLWTNNCATSSSFDRIKIEASSEGMLAITSSISKGLLLGAKEGQICKDPGTLLVSAGEHRR